MLKCVLIGSVLVCLTAGIHAAAMTVALPRVRRLHERLHQKGARRRRPWTVAALVLAMVLASAVESVVWAATYLAVGASEGFERTLYFSMVTFTTLGYGDVVLGEGWRLLASFQAATGTIMFGWTTALIFAAVQSLYLSADSNRTGG